MNNPFSSVSLPPRSHLLWLAWLRALQPLRPACARTTTFLWLVVVLAAFCLRPDLAGVTSLVRSLGLSNTSYYCLLAFFHSPALHLDRLIPLWIQTLQRPFRRRLVRVNDRPVVAASSEVIGWAINRHSTDSRSWREDRKATPTPCAGRCPGKS